MASGTLPTIGGMRRIALAGAGRPRRAGLGRRGVPWWLGLPLVPVQGYRLVRTIPRFADAEGVTGTVGSGERRMKVVALGDSVTAGYAISEVFIENGRFDGERIFGTAEDRQRVAGRAAAVTRPVGE